MERQIKQVICIRKDLKMRRGKEIAQGSHASMAFLTKRLSKTSDSQRHEVSITDQEQQWLESSFAKVCLQVYSEQDLLDISEKAEKAGIECHIITDNGLTEFAGQKTKTCLALGPHYSDEIDKITSHLRLY